MPLTRLYSTTNLQNSVAMYLGSQLIQLGYVVYFLRTDTLATVDAWYPNYRVNQATYQANATYAARLAQSKGMVTLHDGETAFPRFVTRPTNEGAVALESEVQVPVFGISVDPDVATKAYEAGTRLFWRTRALRIDGRARTHDELLQLADALSVWFDENAEFQVADYDAHLRYATALPLSLGIQSGPEQEPAGPATVTRRSVGWEINATAGDQDRFQLELYARLEYVA